MSVKECSGITPVMLRIPVVGYSMKSAGGECIAAHTLLPYSPVRAAGPRTEPSCELTRVVPIVGTHRLCPTLLRSPATHTHSWRRPTPRMIPRQSAIRLLGGKRGYVNIARLTGNFPISLLFINCIAMLPSVIDYTCVQTLLVRRITHSSAANCKAFRRQYELVKKYPRLTRQSWSSPPSGPRGT